MATIVTAFMTNVNNVEFRSCEKYIEFGKKLLSQAIPTVCFLERKIYNDFFQSCSQDYPNTHFIMFERNEIYLYDFEDQLSKYYVHTDNPQKDTPGYMFVQCHKTEWVKQAIHVNPFHTTNFIWIDFGIFHMIKNEMDFALNLNALSTKTYDQVRIASCRDLDDFCENDIFRVISWYFAGSIFGGSSTILLEFASIMKKKCIELIKRKKHIMWEINIWYILYKKYPELFSPYHCNHDLSILGNY